jgi:hypothetical protein
VGHLHAVSYRFLLPELLRADHCCSTLDCPDRFAMIRRLRSATKDIRDLFTLQMFLGHFASSRRKHDCKAPPQDWQGRFVQKVRSKTGRIGRRFSCSGAKSTSIQLIKGPSVCPKSKGATRKIRPRIRNPAFQLRHRRPIGAVSRVSWTGAFLPLDEGDPERNFHWGLEGRGTSPLEIETESRALKLSTSMVRKFPVYRKTSNKTR